MDCILKKQTRILCAKSATPLLTLSPGEFLFSDGTFVNTNSSSTSRTRVLEENTTLLFADASPYSEVEDGLLVTVSNERVIGYPISRGPDGSAEIGGPVLLGEDMGTVTALSVGLNKKWIAVGTAKGGVLLLRLRIEWTGRRFKVLGVNIRGSLEDYSVTHMSFVSNRSNKDSSECILVLLNAENTLKLWRVGDALLVCDFELSSQLGRYPLTSLTVQNHIIAIGNSQGTLFFQHLLSSSKSDFFTRVIGTVHLAEAFQLEQEFFHRDTIQNGSYHTTGFKNNVPNFSSSIVDVGCEILDMTFYGGKINEESHNCHDKPPCLIIGTSVGIVSMNVRTRELISIIPFHHIFAPEEGNINILDSMANGLSINRHSSSFYKARNAVGVVVQTATDGKTWSLNIELEALKRRREIVYEDEEDDETLRILNIGELSFVAKDPILEGSFFNKFNKMRKKRMGMLSKSVPNLGRVFDISKQKIRSSGYGNQGHKRRKMFQPFTNSYKQYEKSLAKIFPSSTSSSPAILSSSPSTLVNGSKSNLMEQRGRWSTTTNALNLSSKLCRNERTLLTFLSSGSRSSSSLANREASELPEILSQANKIWTGDGVLSRLKFSPNGKVFGAYGSEKSAQILSVNGKEGIHLVGHKGPINSIDFSHSRGNSVLTSGTDKTVRLWDWKARVNKVTIGGGDHGSPVDSHGLSNKLNMYRNKFSSNRAKYEKFRFGQDEVKKSSFYYLDQFILSCAGNGLYVHSLEGMDSDYREDIHVSQIDTFIFPKAKTILDFYASNSCFSHIALISCSDKSLKVFDLNYGRAILDIPRAHSRPILSIARSEGGLIKLDEEIGENEDYNLFATYTLGDGAKIWDIRSLEKSCVQRCDWPGSERGGRIASSVDMSPCSKYMVVGGEDGGVYVFDLRMTSSYCSRYTGGSSSSPITGVAFNTISTSNIFATNLQGELFQFKSK